MPHRSTKPALWAVVRAVLLFATTPLTAARAQSSDCPATLSYLDATLGLGPTKTFVGMFDIPTFLNAATVQQCVFPSDLADALRAKGYTVPTPTVTSPTVALPPTGAAGCSTVIANLQGFATGPMWTQSTFEEATKWYGFSQTLHCKLPPSLAGELQKREPPQYSVERTEYFNLCITLSTYQARERGQSLSAHDRYLCDNGSKFANDATISDTIRQMKDGIAIYERRGNQPAQVSQPSQRNSTNCHAVLHQLECGMACGFTDPGQAQQLGNWYNANCH